MADSGKDGGSILNRENEHCQKRSVKVNMTPCIDPGSGGYKQFDNGRNGKKAREKSRRVPPTEEKAGGGAEII